MEIKNKELLAKIADYLETLPDEKFDIYLFCAPDDKCGTVGCIFGHAVLGGLIPNCQYNAAGSFISPRGDYNEWTEIGYLFGEEGKKIFDAYGDLYRRLIP